MLLSRTGQSDQRAVRRGVSVAVDRKRWWPILALAIIGLGFAGADRAFYESVALHLNTPSPVDRDFYHVTLPIWDVLRFFPHIVGAAVAVLGILLVRRDGFRRAVRAAAVVLIAAVAANTLQDVVGRLRPNQADSAWAFAAPLEGLFHRTPVGFPSGEVATAFALACVLHREFPRGGRCVYALAAGVAIARGLFGMHYLSDVAAGALLGHYLARWTNFYVTHGLRFVQRCRGLSWRRRGSDAARSNEGSVTAHDL